MAAITCGNRVFICLCFQVASQLRLFDPQLKEKPEEEAAAEPAWLVQLQLMEKQVKVRWAPVVGPDGEPRSRGRWRV